MCVCVGVKRQYLCFSRQAVYEAWHSSISFCRSILHKSLCHWKLVERAHIIHLWTRGNGKRDGESEIGLKTFIHIHSPENHRREPSFRIKIYRRIQLTLFIFSSRCRLDVNTCDASLFLSCCFWCCSTHLHISATHRFGLFTFACGFTISSSSLPHLTLVFVVIPSSSRNGFRFGLGLALLVFEHYFFSRKLKALPIGCLRTKGTAEKNKKSLFCYFVNIKRSFARLL